MGLRGFFSVPDPNRFDGDVLIKTSNEKAWGKMPVIFIMPIGRGIGLSEMATAINNGYPHPTCKCPNGFHIVDVTESIHESSETAKQMNISSTFEDPAIKY